MSAELQYQRRTSEKGRGRKEGGRDVQTAEGLSHAMLSTSSAVHPPHEAEREDAITHAIMHS